MAYKVGDIVRVKPDFWKIDTYDDPGIDDGMRDFVNLGWLRIERIRGLWPQFCGYSWAEEWLIKKPSKPLRYKDMVL